MTARAELDYSCPGEVVFGHGVRHQLANYASAYANTTVLTTTDENRHQELLTQLEAVTAVTVIRSRGEPTVATAQWATAAVQAAKADCVVALGGGSIIDLAKAAAALATNPGGALRYLEVVGDGQPLAAEPIPVIAVPTTFGTGSEVTRNSVLGVPEHQRKVSLRDVRMVPKVALVDPDLAQGLPAVAAAAAGIDALIHVSEAYVCNAPCAGLVARSQTALKNGFAALPNLVNDPDDASRLALAEASLCGGLCIANAKLGAVHGFAGVLGGRLAAGHGAICGALFAAVVEVNLAALAAQPAHPAVARYAEMAQLVGCATAQLPEFLAELARTIGLAQLGELGVDPVAHAHIAEASKASSSMKGNPVALTQAQLIEVLERAH